MPDSFVHDPEAVLDYTIDWSVWLASDETIASFTVGVEPGIVVDSSASSGGVVTVWLSGGTVGETYEATCHIVTDQGREDDRTIRLRVRQR